MGCRTKRGAVRRAAVVIGVLVGTCLLGSGPAPGATDTYWKAGAEYWRNAGNWTAGVPTASTDVHVNNSGTAITDQPGASCDWLYIGEGVADTGTVWMTAGDLSATMVHAGMSGDGTFVQTDGLLSVDNDIYLGFNATGVGEYRLWAGEVDAKRIVIGGEGSGEFGYFGGTLGRTKIQVADHGTFTAEADWQHEGGLDILGGTLDMGTNTLRLGGETYTAGYETLVGLYGGSLQAADERVGYDDWAAADATVRFYQGGGTHTVSDELGIGCGGYGYYKLYGGNLDAKSVKIGSDNGLTQTGAGDFLQTGGTLTVDGFLLVGDYDDGTYELRDGTLSTRYESVGAHSIANGEFLQTGGTHTVTEYLYVGEGGTGTFTLQGGTLDVGKDIRSGTGTGTFILDGGTLTVGTGVSVQTFILGKEAGRTGEFTLLAGQSMTGQEVIVGDQGIGRLHLVGGTYEPAMTTVGLGGSIDASIDLTYEGELHIQGGTVDCSGHALTLRSPDASTPTSTLESGSLLAADVYVGRWGRSHTFIQTGGTHTVTGTLEVVDGGRYELRAGIGQLTTGGTTIGMPGADSTFIQIGGTHTVNGPLDVGDGGRYELRAGTGVLSIQNQEYVGYYGDATFWQQGGTHTIGNRLNVGFSGGPGDPPHGTFELLGGSLSAPEQDIGTTFGTGEFVQSGGSNTASLGVFVGVSQDGAYTISNGTLDAGSVYVGPNGALHIGGAAATVNVANELHFDSGAVFSAVPGATIHMTGASFYHGSTSPADMAGLENLHVIFEGGPDTPDPFEVASRDRGASWSGWNSNFALDTLQLGGADVGRVLLRDITDNQPGWQGAEALYVDHLEIGPASALDLNGHNLYCMTSDIDPAATITGGDITHVPGLMPNIDIEVISPKQFAFTVRLTAFDVEYAAKMVAVEFAGEMAQVKQKSGDATPTLSYLQPLTPEERALDTHFLLFDDDLTIVQMTESTSKLKGQFEVLDKILAQDLPLARIVAKAGEEIHLVGQVVTAEGVVIPLDVIVPEPVTLALVAAGLAFSAIARRRCR